MTDAEIYETLRWDLMRYATALVGGDDAGDVVSAVVMRVLARSGGLAGLRDPKPYLMRAVLNEVRSQHRTRVKRPTVPISSVPDPTRQPEHDDVIGLIDSLPPRQRAAAFLVFHQGHTPSEAAQMMGCRPGTVRRYLHLARTKLQEALDE